MTVIGVTLSRKLGLVIVAWGVLLAALIVGLPAIGLSSVVVGGMLGAYCGATIVVVYGARERALKNQKPRGPLDDRYGRR